MKLLNATIFVLSAQFFGVENGSACDIFSTSPVMSNAPTSISDCQTLSRVSAVLAETPSDYSKVTKENSVKGYWSNWVFETEYSPLVTGKIKSNFIGLGVWMPSELTDLVDEMQYEEWLFSHGLQLSLGFGEQSGSEPRLRVDYRWHQEAAADVMFQLELPF